MENKELNIAEILKDKPKDTKLWSDTFGNVTLKDVTISKSGGYPIFLTTNINDEALYLDMFGRYHKNVDGVRPCIVPSKEMRDWEKFAWKKGDVLINGCGFQCIFKEWTSDDYTKFNGCYSNSRDGYEDVPNADTMKFQKVDNNIACGYLREIEETLGGKLNLSTLEIKKRPEFKNGDILTCNGFIFIFKNKDESVVYPHATCDIGNKDNVVCNEYKPFASNRHIKDFKYATEEEKQRLFDALAKKGKQWDAEKKQIVDMQFKPFDKVLVRDASTGCWRSAFFVCFDKDSGIKGNYIAFTLIGGHSNHFHQCIPYNEETKHLLDTTDNWEGGEK